MVPPLAKVPVAGAAESKSCTLGLSPHSAGHECILKTLRTAETLTSLSTSAKAKLLCCRRSSGNCVYGLSGLWTVEKAFSACCCYALR
jgi:hypothetical protein